MHKTGYRNRADRFTTLDGIEYKLVKVVDKTQENLHHIIGRCNRKRANVESPENKVKIRIFKHNGLNALFGDQQSPQEQLKVLFDIRKPTLSDKVRGELATLLTLEKSEFYNPELLKCMTKKQKKEKK